jgi:hypothetical protein
MFDMSILFFIEKSVQLLHIDRRLLCFRFKIHRTEQETCVQSLLVSWKGAKDIILRSENFEKYRESYDMMKSKEGGQTWYLYCPRLLRHALPPRLIRPPMHFAETYIDAMYLPFVLPRVEWTI